MNDAENCSVGADTQSQCQQRDDTKNRLFQQASNAVAKIFPKDIHKPLLRRHSLDPSTQFAAGTPMTLTWPTGNRPSTNALAPPYSVRATTGKRTQAFAIQPSSSLTMRFP